jgi:pimeloyl-ACP methyl ester carboxylesterase
LVAVLDPRLVGEEAKVSRAQWRRVVLPDAVLEVAVRGSGEPIVLIQTALTADEFLPLASQSELQDHYQVILYHRRGYVGSTPVQGPGSIERDALDCRRLLSALDIESAHVVGVSYSAAVALQLAAAAPSSVRTLTLIEPPPVHTPSADEFLAANAAFMADHRLLGSATALDKFLARVIGTDWRTDIQHHLPGGVAQVEADADTFFATDMPALVTWRFTAEDARRVTQPVLYIGGSESGPWFAEVRELILAWLPQARDVVLEGADHSLAMTHSAQVAAAIRAFLREQPVGA